MIKTILFGLILFAVIIFLVWFAVKIILYYFPEKKKFFDSHKDLFHFILALIALIVTFIQTYYPIKSHNDLDEVVHIDTPNSKDSISVVVETTTMDDDIFYNVSIDLNKNTLYSDGDQILGYRSGKYRIEEIPNGKYILNNIGNKLNTFLSKTNNKNIRVEVELFGQSDCTPAKGSRYLGDLGLIKNVQFFNANTGNIEFKNLTPNRSRIWNADYGFLRLYSCELILRDQINFPFTTYKRIQNVSKNRGLKERLTIVKIRVINGLKRDFDNFNMIEKFVYKIQN